MRTLVVPLVGVQLLMAIPGAFVLEQLGAVLALEGQVLGMALQGEKNVEESQLERQFKVGE